MIILVSLNTVKSKFSPAKGGPMIAAAPLNRLRRPNELVNLSSPTISTKMIEVNDMYAAEIQKIKKNYIKLKLKTLY